MAHENKLTGRSVKVREFEHINQSLRRLKKKVLEDGVLEESRQRQFFEKPTTIRKRSKAAAKARWKKKVSQQQLPKKSY